jgi:putative ABC transport system ATP-binding protein
MYELTSVSKRYGNATVGVDALKEVDLRIRDGELLAIVGPSGSGKSTMLQMLGGLDHPTSGSVVLNGKDLAQMGDADLTAVRRDTLGFVFQNFNLIATLSALDNVEIALVPAGVASDERRARAHAALESFGLGDRIEHLPSELSGGEQQRVAIARALVGEPQVLLADEPTGNLDSATGAELMQLLRGLNSEHGHTIVLVTHDTGIARQMGRVVEMEDGRILRKGAPA